MSCAKPMTLIIVAMGLIVAVPTVALAAWAQTGTASGRSASAELQPPSTASAAPTSSAPSSSITITWSAPAGGVAPTGYRVERVSPPAVICPNTAAMSCVDSGRSPATSYSYNVFALLQAWDGNATSASAATSAATDTTPPTISANCPTANSNYDLGNSGANSWNCGGGNSLRVDVADSSGVASARFKLQQTENAQCWSGTSWSTANCSAGDGSGYFTATAPSSGSAWTLPLTRANLASVNVNGSGTKNYVLSVKATDSANPANTTAPGSPYTVTYKTNN